MAMLGFTSFIPTHVLSFKEYDNYPNGAARIGWVSLPTPTLDELKD
jgi:hypothetical protein